MKEASIRRALERLPSQPDDAGIPVPVAEAYTGLTGRTLRYHPLIRRIYYTNNRYSLHLGDLRKFSRDATRLGAVS